MTATHHQAIVIPVKVNTTTSDLFRIIDEAAERQVFLRLGGEYIKTLNSIEKITTYAALAEQFPGMAHKHIEELMESGEYVVYHADLDVVRVSDD